MFIHLLKREKKEKFWSVIKFLVAIKDLNKTIGLHVV